MNPDDFLRQRLRDLRDDDATRAPAFDRVMQGRTRSATARVSRLAWAAAAAVVAVTGAMLWQSPRGSLPELSPAAVESLEAAVEPVPSDALLAGGEIADTTALAREINALLNR